MVAVLVVCGCSDDRVTELETQDDAPATAPITGAAGFAPGSLDETFGPDGTGITRIKFGADDDGQFTALDASGGSIIATGSGTGGLGEISMKTMRFTPDGLVDPAWNGGAVARTSFGTSSTGDHATARAIGRQGDGGIIILGTNHDAGSRPPCPCSADLAAARYAPTDGALDPSFGTGGKSTVDLGGDELISDGVVVDGGAIVAVGAQDGHFLIAQLTASGALDPSFATAGYDRVVRGTASRADAVALDAAHRIAVAGTITEGAATSIVVSWYLATGARDGELLVASAANEQAVALRAHGAELYLASSATTAGRDAVRVRRLLADGSLDATFGSGGIAEIPDRAALAMVVLPDGTIAVLTAQSTVVRLTAAGAIDPVFGTEGEVAISFGDFGVPGGLQVDGEGRLLVSGGDAGGTPGPGTYGVVERLRM
jgi:uncharacterized delta-60 repeat protein